MPKIIAPPKSEEEITVTCPYCGCTLSYTEDEEMQLNNHEWGIECCWCHNEFPTKEISTYTFPEAFCKHSTDRGAVHVEQEEIQKMINEIAKELPDCTIGEYLTFASGDTIVIGIRAEDEDIIYVAQGYYEGFFYK